MVKNNLGTRHPFLERALEDALNKNDKLKEMLVDIANQHRCDLSIFTEGEEKKQNEEKEKEKEEEEKEKEEYAGY
jgi:predicted RNA-binding protein with RPS1 domain